jgi:hypothetical protein
VSARTSRRAANLAVYVLSLLAAFALLACAGQLPAPTAQPAHGRLCSATLGPGQDVAGSLSSAAAGSVICLRTGHYPVLKLANLHPDGYVTLQPASGQRPTLAGIEGEQIDFLRVQGLTVRGPIELIGGGRDIQIAGNDVGPSTCGIYLYAWSGNVMSDIAIEHNHIHDLDFSGPEEVCSGYGIQAVGGVQKVSILANTIEHVANDYIQLGGGDDWTVAKNLFLGPSLRYTHATVHQDLWQVFGGGSHLRFIDNVARNTQTDESLLFQSGVYHDLTITNNLFNHDSAGYSVQMFQIDGLVFTHNTFIGSHWGVLFRADDPNAGPGRGYRVQYNIFGKTSSSSPAVSETPNFGTFDYNVSQDGSASGPHSLRHWHPRWAAAAGYEPLCLPFQAGYHSTSSGARAAFSRRWRHGCL